MSAAYKPRADSNGNSSAADPPIAPRASKTEREFCRNDQPDASWHSPAEAFTPDSGMYLATTREDGQGRAWGKKSKRVHASGTREFTVDDPRLPQLSRAHPGVLSAQVFVPQL